MSHGLNAFANESFIDELAAAAGKDPSTTAVRCSPRSRSTCACSTGRRQGRLGQAAAGGRKLGIALMEGYGTYMAQVAEVR